MKNVFRFLGVFALALTVLTSCSQYEYNRDMTDFFEGEWELTDIGVINNQNQRQVTSVVRPAFCDFFQVFTFRGGNLRREIFNTVEQSCASQVVNGQYQRVTRNISMTFTMPGETEPTQIDASIARLTQTEMELIFTENSQLRVWILKRTP